MPSSTRHLPDPSRRRTLSAWWALTAAAGTPWLGSPARAAALRDWPADRAVPALDLPQLDGPRWRLSDQRGHPVVLNFWASWCGPCRDEMPSLELMAQRHAADGLRVMAVNYQEGERTIRRFVEQLPFSLPVLLDTDGRATQAWTSRVFPTTVLIGRDGRPRRTVLGEVDWGSPQAREWMTELVRDVSRS